MERNMELCRLRLSINANQSKVWKSKWWNCKAQIFDKRWKSNEFIEKFKLFILSFNFNFTLINNLQSSTLNNIDGWAEQLVLPLNTTFNNQFEAQSFNVNV